MEQYNAKELMSEAKFFEAYSRYNDDLGRYETWDEAVNRVMNMHREYYSEEMTDLLSELLSEVETSYRAKEFLGAQRALQFGGKQLLAHQARLYNCASSYADRPSFYGETFYLMLCGTGVGFSVQKHHNAKLPPIAKRTKAPKTFVVPDSIEGWQQAVDILTSSFFVGGGKYPEYEGKKVYFDLEKIRPKGAYVSGGFKAPGPDGLRVSLEKIEAIFKRVLSDGRDRLKPIESYDIVMFIADAVLSGGIRRAATICMFSWDDEEMIKAKTGSWFVDNPQRGRSNNSAVLLRGEVTFDHFKGIMESVKHSGEPGFIWVDDLDITLNPCVTKDTSVLTSEGPKLVEDLIGRQFKAVVNGKEYSTTEKGFWKTGTKDVYKLTLKDGKSLSLTSNHKVKTQRGWVEVKDLTSEDSVVFHNHEGYSWGSSGLDQELGWLLGNLVGDGTFANNSAILRYWNKETYLAEKAREFLTRNCATYKDFNGSSEKNIVSVGSVRLAELALEFGISPRSKSATHKLEETSSDFYVGYIRGLFDADGSVQGGHEKGVSIRLTQNNLEILEQVQRMLLRLGINSTIYMNRSEEGYHSFPDGNGGYKEYFRQSVHELVISKSSLQVYNDRIGFHCIAKATLLEKLLSTYKRPLYKDTFSSPVSSITLVSTEDVYDVTVPGPDAFDANGLFVHNCCEIGMYPQTSDGRSGFQMCNLTEINGGLSKTKEMFLHQCKIASIMGTIQAGYTQFKHVSPETREIVEKEALIGVSITGWMNNPNTLFDEETMKEGAEEVKKWNRIVAELIGINPAARTTTVKPSGNASVLLGTASGIHGEHSPRYLRHVQFNKDTEVAQLFMKENPDMCEDSVYNRERDITVAFPVISDEGSIYKRDLLGVKQLSFVKLAQENWVEHGTNVDLCVKPYIRHNVSNTITVDDWDEVTQYIYDNRYAFCGVSLMAASGDKAYPQAPFTDVLTHLEIIEKYGEESLFTSALIEAGLTAFNGDLWSGCNTALGFGEELKEGHEYLLKRDFIRRFRKFAESFYSFTEEEVTEYNTLVDEFNSITKFTQIVKEKLTTEPEDSISDEEYEELNNLILSTYDRLVEIKDRIAILNIPGKIVLAEETCANCLKDVYNLHKWWRIQKNLKPINWASDLKKKEYVDLDSLAGQACAGGACEVAW